MTAARNPIRREKGYFSIRACGFRFVVAIVAVLAAAAGSPVLAEDAPPPVVDPDPCATEPSSPDDAARAVFERVAVAWRSRLPGPAGERALVQKVSALVREHTDFNVFATRAFGHAWAELDEAHREAWQRSLESVIERRYLDRVGSPLGARLEVRDVETRCPEANLALRVIHRDHRKTSNFDVELRWDGVSWRVVDAVVGEASLLDMYRTRFGRAYRDGGVKAVKEHLTQLAKRFGAPEPNVPEPEAVAPETAPAPP